MKTKSARGGNTVTLPGAFCFLWEADRKQEIVLSLILTEERQRAEGSYAEGKKFFKSPQPLSFQAPEFIYGTLEICPIKTRSDPRILRPDFKPLNEQSSRGRVLSPA
ncbi:MAG: hypothetical protein PUP92_26515, partial [Rhizonema sp. PD38]|nr:hypothetical protein [Rhizonema sp. PD38]